MKSHPQDKHYRVCSGKAAGNAADGVCMPPSWYPEKYTQCKSNTKMK